jgi:hypothetical protein
MSHDVAHVLVVWCALEAVNLAEARRAVRRNPSLEKLGVPVGDVRLLRRRDWELIKTAVATLRRK